MKKFLFSLSIFALVFTSCENDPALDDIPSCVQEEIKEASRSKDSGAKLTQYRYNAESVYAFEPGEVYPDILFSVVNEHCAVVCQFGGFAGMNTCPDFSENAELVGVLWEND